MIWIGLTGGIGTGKSIVASFLREFGYPVVDADQIAHKSFEKNSEVYSEIIKVFGDKILKPDQSIDRKLLGQIVFSNKKDLQKLENIVHPFVQKIANQERRSLESTGHKLAFYDVPLLFEKELQSKFDKTLLVYAPIQTQKARVLKRDRLPGTEVDKRIASQISIEIKKDLADIVIENTGSLADLKVQVKEVVNELLGSTN
jgi:dephospho-CoA kinase